MRFNGCFKGKTSLANNLQILLGGRGGGVYSNPITRPVVVYSFLRKPVQQRCPDVMSFCMQFEIGGRGLLREAFQSKGKSVVGCKNDVTSVHLCWTGFRKKTIVYCSCVPQVKMLYHNEWL